MEIAVFLGKYKELKMTIINFNIKHYGYI